MIGMSEQNITAAVRLDKRQFRRFALYDAFALRRLWVRPALFAAIMLAFALAALIIRRDQSGLIAAVLLAVGLGLPAVWVGTYISQVDREARRLHLDPPRLVYTVTLAERGIHVQHARREGESLDAAWDQIVSIRRCRKDTYLYLSRTQAFILPAGQADAPDEAVERFLTGHARAAGDS